MGGKYPFSCGKYISRRLLSSVKKGGNVGTIVPSVQYDINILKH